MSCLALLGIFVPSPGWHWVLFVWVYALAWFLVTDRVKLLAYRVFDPTGVADEPGEEGTSQPEVRGTAAAGAHDAGPHAAIG